jgi:ABC-type branched-subunit amino acid transport system substrate-binding protein
MAGRVGWARTSTVLLIGALVLAACSSTSRGSSGGTTATTAATATSAATASTAAPPTKFGTLASPCGPGTASGATDQGVTDKTITIGYGDDAGYAGDPGVTEMSDAVRAFMKWCNDQGGILGRQVVGEYEDAAVFNVVSKVQALCTSAFMLVGEGWALDEGAEQERVGCNLVAVPAYTAGVDIANGPMMFQPAPNPDDYFTAASLFQAAKLWPVQIKAADALHTTLSASEVSIAKVVEGGTDAGFKWLNCGVKVNFLGEPDYKPFAQRFQSCGAKLIFSNQPPGPLTYNFLTALDQLGYHPIILGEADVYGPAMAQWNTAGVGNNVYVRLAFQPLENASAVPVVQQYLDIVHASGGKVGELGEQAASAFLLWATAAKSCGSDLTRQCMVNTLAKIHQWDGGGIQAMANPGSNLPPICGMIVKLTGTSWSQFYPTTQGQMDCSPSYVVPITGAAIGTTLNANRISTKFLGPNVLTPMTS